LERRQFPLDHSQYIDESGRLVVDRIYKYEELDYALAEICKRIGIPNSPLLVREKSGFRDDVPSLQETMRKSDQVKIIFDAFEETLRYVDYSPR
jgi:hypothetical protein